MTPSEASAVASLSNYSTRQAARIAKLEADMAMLVALVDRSFAAINAGIAMADAEWRNSDSAVDRNDRIIRDYRNDAREALTRNQGEYRSGEAPPERDETDWHIVAQDIAHHWGHPDERAIAYQAAGEAIKLLRGEFRVRT